MQNPKTGESTNFLIPFSPWIETVVENHMGHHRGGGGGGLTQLTVEEALNKRLLTLYGLMKG